MAIDSQGLTCVIFRTHFKGLSPPDPEQDKQLYRMNGWRDYGNTIPKESSASSFSEDDWRVWWHLEVSVSFLDPVLLLSVHCVRK